MILQTIPPRPDAQPLIQNLWRLQADGLHQNTLLPSPTVTFVIHLTGAILGQSGNPAAPVPRLALSGPRDVPKTVTYTPGTVALLVELRPGRARSVLGLPVEEFFGQTVSAHEVWGTDADRLQERLERAPTDRDRIDVLQDFLVSRTLAPQGLTLAERALPLFGPGAPSIGHLVAQLATNKDSLEKSFRREFGVGPKRFARIGRLRAAVSRMTQAAPLGPLAHDLGFSDQSHFNHEFRAMVGLSPTEFLQKGERW